MSDNGHTFVSGHHFSSEKWLEVNVELLQGEMA